MSRTSDSATSPTITPLRTSLLPGYFEVMGMELIAGNTIDWVRPMSMDTRTVIVNETLVAAVGWNPQEAIGQTINGRERVVGVVRDFHPDDLRTPIAPTMIMRDIYERPQYLFVNLVLYGFKEGVKDFTYLVLPEGYSLEAFENISDSFNERYVDQNRRGLNLRIRYYLEPLADIHLDSTTTGDRPRGNTVFLATLLALACFVLTLACINYMNLATARATRRAKEVDMRKTLGAQRTQLILQFLGESQCLSLAAVPLALLFTEIILTMTPLTGSAQMSWPPQPPWPRPYSLKITDL